MSTSSPSTTTLSLRAVKPLLSVGEAAREAGKSRSTMYRLIDNAPAGSDLYRSASRDQCVPGGTLVLAGVR